MWVPLPIEVTFDGDPDHLAMFLGHVLSHLDRFTLQYSSPWAMVVAITASLQGEVAAWATDLFSDHARELGDVGFFLEALRARFEDPSQVQLAEAEILGLRQKGRPVREYVREFQRVAGWLRTWPECLLVHHFHWGLDKDMQQACVMRGVPSRLQDWFRVITEVDAGLQEFRVSLSDQSFIRRTGPRPTEVSGQPKMSTPSVRSTFRCFRCNRPGHRVAECPVPELTTTPRSQEKPSPMQKKTPEQSRAARQTEESIPQQVPITTSLTSPDESLVEYNNADPDEDPMGTPGRGSRMSCPARPIRTGTQGTSSPGLCTASWLNRMSLWHPGAASEAVL